MMPEHSKVRTVLESTPLPTWPAKLAEKVPQRLMQIGIPSNPAALNLKDLQAYAELESYLKGALYCWYLSPEQLAQKNEEVMGKSFFVNSDGTLTIATPEQLAESARLYPGGSTGETEKMLTAVAKYTKAITGSDRSVVIVGTGLSAAADYTFAVKQRVGLIRYGILIVSEPELRQLEKLRETMITCPQYWQKLIEGEADEALGYSVGYMRALISLGVEHHLKKRVIAAALYAAKEITEEEYQDMCQVMQESILPHLDGSYDNSNGSARKQKWYEDLKSPWLLEEVKALFDIDEEQLLQINRNTTLMKVVGQIKEKMVATTKWAVPATARHQQCLEAITSYQQTQQVQVTGICVTPFLEGLDFLSERILEGRKIRGTTVKAGGDLVATTAVGDRVQLGASKCLEVLKAKDYVVIVHDNTKGVEMVVLILGASKWPSHPPTLGHGLKNMSKALAEEVPEEVREGIQLCLQGQSERAKEWYKKNMSETEEKVYVVEVKANPRSWELFAERQKNWTAWMQEQQGKIYWAEGREEERSIEEMVAKTVEVHSYDPSGKNMLGQLRQEVEEQQNKKGKPETERG